jgi:hypothetical protein
MKHAVCRREKKLKGADELKTLSPEVRFVVLYYGDRISFNLKQQSLTAPHSDEGSKKVMTLQ